MKHTEPIKTLIFEELSGRTGSHHIAVSRLRPGQRTTTHTHDFVELCLVEDGRGTETRNGREWELGRGSLDLIQARDAHSYRSAPATRLAFINLAFPAWWWEGFLRLLSPRVALEKSLLGNPRGHVLLDQPATRAAAHAMHDLLERGAAEPALLPEVVAGLVRHLTPQPNLMPAGGATQPEWLTELVRDLKDPELLPRPFSFWQRRAGVSPAHFSRACRRFLGEPPTVLLNRARIECVKLRLRLGGEKITSIALDAGFQNLGFFYRSFRRFEACTPREWAARHAAAVTVPR